MVRVWRVLRSPRKSLKGLALAQRPGRSEREHIFVVGVPRAGTTLLSTIFATHPDVAALRVESHFFMQRNYQYLKLPGMPDSVRAAMLRTAQSQAELFDQIGEYVIAQKPGAVQFLEKTPGHALKLPFLLESFPNARFIFLVRDPRDAFISLTGGKGLPQFTLEEYVGFWNRLVDNGISAPKNRVQLVRYEDLSRDPAGTVADICRFLGLAYSERLIDPDAHRSQLPFYHDQGDHDQIGTTISVRSIGKWRDRLSPEQARRIESECATLMTVLNYAADVDGGEAAGGCVSR